MTSPGGWPPVPVAATISSICRADAQVQLRGFRIELARSRPGCSRPTVWWCGGANRGHAGDRGAAHRVRGGRGRGPPRRPCRTGAGGDSGARVHGALDGAGCGITAAHREREARPRRRCRSPEFGTAADGFTAPQSAQEILVAEAFAEVLGGAEGRCHRLLLRYRWQLAVGDAARRPGSRRPSGWGRDPRCLRRAVGSRADRAGCRQRTRPRAGHRARGAPRPVPGYRSPSSGCGSSTVSTPPPPPTTFR